MQPDNENTNTNAIANDNVNANANMDGKELSMDELDAVSGGVTTRNWQTDGCAATVEAGSDCWGTDGGCLAINISYTGVSESDRCRVRTTGPCKYEEVGYEENQTYVPQDMQDLGYKPRIIPTTYEQCIYCGRRRITYQY